MGILFPAALALLALAVPIIAFYMLRLRREELAVSSSLLWRRALLDRTANAPWQRLRRNLLLLLQLLLLLLLVLSLARPFFQSGVPSEGNIVVVLDASASMQATDETDSRSRFERAKSEAGALADALGTNEMMSLIWAGPAPAITVASSGNKSVLHAGLRSMKPSNGTANIQQALTLAAATAKQAGNATIVLISDGALATASGTEELPAMPVRTRYINVGKSSANMAITALSLRDTPSGPQLFANVYNSATVGTTPAEAILSIKVDGSLRDSRKVTVPPGGSTSVTLEDLPLTTHLVEADLVPTAKGSDYLAADNRAYALRVGTGTSNVLLVSDGNSFLEKGLNLMRDVKLFKVAPKDYSPSDGFGLTVLDGAVPAARPSGNLLLFAPPDSALLPVSGTVPYPVVGTTDANDPLVRYVDLSKTHISEAARFITPAWARVIARTTDGDPLIIAGETGGRRIVAVAFSLHKSDLPLQVAFPILLTNIVEWLRPGTALETPSYLSAGEPISIRPLPSADEIIVTPPGGGSDTTLQPASSVTFAGTEELGIYTVRQIAGGKPLAEPELFAVNLFNREESNITPHPELAFAGTNSSQPPSGSQHPEEIWPWVLLLALGVLSIEWWLYNRGGGIALRRKRILASPSLRKGKA